MCGQVSSIAASPWSNSACIHIGSSSQIVCCCQDILYLASPSCSEVFLLPKVHPIADATAVIERQGNVALGCKILLGAVGVGIVQAIVVAQKHLPAATSVHENDSRILFLRVVVGR